MVVDSDRLSEGNELDQKRKQWKESCESDNALFHAWRFSEMECYLSGRTLARLANGVEVDVPKYRTQDGRKAKHVIVEFANRHGLERNIPSLFAAMTAEEMLERDEYSAEDGSEGHEILELLGSIRKMIK